MMPTDYLHHALMWPDRPSLALYDRRQRAYEAFCSLLDTRMKMFPHVVAREHRLEFVFPQGGYLRFGYANYDMQLWDYRGIMWQNVFSEGLHNPQLSQIAVGLLFKPVYNGCGDGVQ